MVKFFSTQRKKMQHCSFCFSRKPAFQERGGRFAFCNSKCQIQYYFINGSDEKKRKTGEIRKFNNCDSFGETITIPISQIICGQLRFGRDWKLILSGVKCTDIGSRVARSLIRVASTRIFASPEQSILEPIVNSIDAVSPTQKTGKFGMGFFSLLYWVVNNNATILVDSSYRLTNDSFCGYKATIFSENDELMIKLEDSDDDATFSSTHVEVAFSIDDDLMRKFTTQLEKLRFIKTANISNGFGNKLNGIDPKKPNITVSLKNNRFYCQDSGPGITREVLLGSLLFPTVSTKTIQMSTNEEDRKYQSHPSIALNDDNIIVVLVNNIAIIQAKFKTDMDKKFRIVIDLPPWTRIPVSRDDVDLSSVVDYFSYNLLQLTLLFINLQYNIIPLESAMEELRRQTASENNHAIIDGWEKSKGQNVLFVHEKHATVYMHLQQYFIDTPFVVSKKWNMMEIEKEIDNNPRIKGETGHFFGRSVIFLDTGKKSFVTAGGLSKYLFVDKERTRDENWTVHLMGAVYDATLYPITLDNPAIESAEITEKQKELLSTIFMQEKTVLRNGWIAKKRSPLRNSLDDYIDLIKNGMMTDNMLEIITTQWYPIFMNPPFNYVYGSHEETYNTFLTDYVDSYFNINPRELKTLIYKKEHKKAMRFAEEMFQRCVNVSRDYRDRIEYVDLYDVYVRCLFPVLSIILDTFTNGLLKLILEKCKTLEHFYKCHRTLHYIAKIRYTRDLYTQAMAKFNMNTVDRIADQLIFFMKDSYKNETGIMFNSAGHKTYSPDLDDDTHEPTQRCAGAFISWLKDLTPEKDEIYELPRFAPSKYASKFTLNEFIGYSFQKDLPSSDPKQLLAVTREISGTQSLKTQMIEIVVNEGTTKEPSIAQLTEMVQNSIDAIREFNPDNSDIDIEIYHVDDIMVLKMTDYVGISMQGIIAMSIPFYSTKTPNQIMTGEMGTGFFNVYRSDRVYINTTRNGTTFEIMDEPVKDMEGKRVLDVNRTFYTIEDKFAKNRTDIVITTRIPQNIYAEVTRAKLYVQNVLGLIDMPMIRLNHNQIGIKRNLLNKTDTYEFYTIESSKGNDYISYVMTKGIPFAPLDSLNIGVDRGAMKLISKNCIVNILSGYTPVQTRTKITMNKKDEEELARFITNCAYDYVISKPVDEVGKYIEHYQVGKNGNLVDVKQVIPISEQWDDLENNTSESVFISNYGSINDSIDSILYYIERIIDHWDPIESGEELTDIEIIMRKIDKENEDGIDYFKDLLAQRTKRDVNKLRIVKAWFVGKKNPIKVKKEKRESKVVKKEEHSMRANVQRFIYAWIDIYIEIGKKLSIFPENRYLKRVYVLDDAPKGVAASYHPAEEAIYYYVEDDTLFELVMIMSIFSILDDQEMAKKIMEYELSNSMWQNVFSPRGTLAHEVEHFRRHTSHQIRGTHSNIMVDLPTGGFKNRNYEQCHADTMISILNENFYVKLRERLKLSTLSVIPRSLQMQIFNDATPLNKFKMLLAADKETYRYLTDNAPWEMYVAREFEIETPANVNFRWLYWALVATNSLSSWRAWIIYFKSHGGSRFRNSDFSLSVHELQKRNMFEISIFENNFLGDKREFWKKLHAELAPFVHIFPKTLFETFEMATVESRGHSFTIQVEKLPDRQSIVWMIYVLLSIGYNVELKEPDNVLSEKTRYFVRSHI